VLALVSGCAATRSGTPVGMSDAPPEPVLDAPSHVQPAPAALWPDFQAARDWPEAAPPARALAHRRDGTLIRVRVEPSALPAYQALAIEAPMPDGARVMAWHETTDGELLGGYLLEKREGIWSALEVDARGALVAGDRAACVRCHDMAPTDHLFGRPAASPAVPTGSSAIGSSNRESIKPRLR
jgi:hypothetical protein